MLFLAGFELWNALLIKNRLWNVNLNLGGIMSKDFFVILFGSVFTFFSILIVVI